MFQKIFFLIFFLFSFEAYSINYEYDKEVTAIYDEKFNLCYYTLRKSKDEISIYLNEDETCEDFLSFNNMISESKPNKARLPFEGEVEGVNFEKRLITKKYYKAGKIEGSEYYKSGKIIFVNNENTNTVYLIDSDKNIELEVIETKNNQMLTLKKNDKKILEFFPVSNNKPKIFEKDIANKLHSFKTFKFKIEINEDSTIKNFYLYMELFGSLNLWKFHDNNLKASYRYDIEKEFKKYKYRLNNISFYYDQVRLVNVYFKPDEYDNYKETRYFNTENSKSTYTKESVYSDSWICKNLKFSHVINESECLNFDQTYINEVMDKFFNSYNHPLYPDQLFTELGFK